MIEFRPDDESTDEIVCGSFNLVFILCRHLLKFTETALSQFRPDDESMDEIGCGSFNLVFILCRHLLKFTETALSHHGALSESADLICDMLARAARLENSTVLRCSLVSFLD